jgi:hypothetical protein
MYKLKTVALGLLVALIAFAGSGTGIESKADEKKDNKKETVSDLMQKKLKYSQKILEGIALNDFDTIAKYADEVVLVSRDAEWKVVKSPRYELFSDEFRGNAETLIKVAKEKNLDGAALAYVEMTLNCVKCHKYVREVRMTRLDVEQPSIAALSR